MMNNLLNTVIIYFVLSVIVILLSKLEKIFVCKPENEPKIYESKSLLYFKVTRHILIFLASAEVILLDRGLPHFAYIIIGLVSIVLGILLRILAIRELGSLWCYHIGLYAGHRRIETGIYSRLTHPAYIGNIYIAGLTVLIGATITSLVALVFVICFYSYRSTREEPLIRCLSV